MKNKSVFGYSIFIVTLFFVLARVTISQPQKGSPGVDVKPQETLAAHNKARAEVGVGPMVWNDTLAAYAQSFANQKIEDCDLTHSSGPYGENIIVGKNPESNMSGPAAVGYWMEEKPDYKSNTHTCDTVCDDYTQVVWRNSVRLGCGSVRCQNDTNIWIMCSYDPPGNIPGQLPY
ncbi:Pathogenesis-related protein 1 [Cardamine amara subsp. amara]|uniref:Pathogenesis-related protein 1 n=1 Tax=Cardamine amara subsp. amara TaxID=228776 RepID=A0ABD1BMC6_CARAN